MLEAIGTELKVIRIRNNLKLNEVADDFKLNQETLRRYENNASGLSVERLEELLNYYKVDKDIFFKNICDYLKEYFKNRKISQYDIESKTGISQSKLSLVFNNKRKLTAEELLLIANEYNIDLNKIKKEIKPA